MAAHSTLSICRPRLLGAIFFFSVLIVFILSMTHYGIQGPSFTNLRQCLASKDVQLAREGAALGSTTMEFKEHYEYQNLSHDSDAVWQQLLTPNGGFLIKTSEEGTRSRYGIGMFHQLHCLQMIRNALQDRSPRMSCEHASDDDEEHGISDHENRGHDAEVHILHCIDYLRQLVLCTADDTLETPKQNAQGRGIIDGMTTHQCRNSKALYDLSEKSPPWSLSDELRMKNEN